MRPMHEMVEIEKARIEAVDSPLLRALDIGKRVMVRFRGVPQHLSPLLPEEGFEYVVAQLRNLVANDYDALVLITGQTGSGKSTLALQLATACDMTFDLTKRLCYTPLEIAKAYVDILPGQAIIYDEAVRGLQSADTFAKEQKELVKLFSVIRAKRAILFLLAPSPWQVAKQVRDTLTRMWLHAERRGLARIYRAWPLIKYAPDSNLRFADNVDCPKLTWTAYPPHDPFYLRYQQVKAERMNELVNETVEKLSGKSMSMKGATTTDTTAVIEWVAENIRKGTTPTVRTIASKFHVRTAAALKARQEAADKVGGEAATALTSTPAAAPAATLPPPPPSKKRSRASRKAWSKGQTAYLNKKRLAEAQKRNPARPSPKVTRR